MASRAVRAQAALGKAGVPPAAARQALDPPPLRIQETEKKGGGEGLALVGTLLLYIAIISFGYVVTSGRASGRSRDRLDCGP